MGTSTSKTIRYIVWTLICTFFFGLLMSLAGVVCADELKPVPDTIGQKTVGPQKPEPAPAPQPAQIIFPTIPVIDQDQVPDEDFLPSPPVPKPPQQPKFVTELSEETWLVIESPESIVVTSSPLGCVNIQPEDGPVKVRGKFADGTGKIETRTFTSKHLYFINAVKQGKVEILVFNPGIVTQEKDIPRFPLTVMGLQPNPPPGPGPTPDPPPTPEPVVKSFRVIFVKESGETLNAEQSAIPGAKAIREYLNAKTTGEAGGVGWREYDPQEITTNETPIMKKLWEETVKPSITYLPCLVIEVNGHAVVKPFPKNVAEALDVLKKAGGE